MPIQQLMLGSTPGAEKKYIDDYFSTYLYTGTLVILVQLQII